MTIDFTKIIVTSLDSDYQIPGDMSPASIVSAYATQIPGISNMTFTERVEGNTRIVTFSPRTGTKGVINFTKIIVTSLDSDYQIPGDMSPASIVSAYATQIPGISNMTFTERVEGETRIVTFSPRTGTKG